VTEQTNARDLFRAAYENRYTWDKDFPGYSADAKLRYDDREYTGKVQINPNLKAEVLDVADSEAKKAIAEQAWEIAIHRVRRAFEDTHAKNSFSLGETDSTGAVEIIVGGGSEGDRYKIRNNEVCMVHRQIHGVVVTINTFSSHQTSEGYLSHRYDSVYHDPATGEQKGGVSEFEDNYEKVGDYYVLTQRRIKTTTDSKTVTAEFSFSNVKLLEPAVV
jgi:Protein of unknown function (DUF3386)